MKKILKYELKPITTPQFIKIPGNMKILAFQFQDDVPIVWVAVEESWHTHDYEFMVIMTGQEFESFGWDYIGTAQAGDIVFHLFFHGTA